MALALISAYNKEGIVDFVKQLIELDFEIAASRGTAKTLLDAGIFVRDVSSLVGGGPILGHRVVTLSREIHAGLLSTDSEEDVKELKELGIPKIDLVCVDLYPLEEEIEKPQSTKESVIEMTDIGGPTILRSAAKGKRIVVCDPKDRQRVINWLKEDRPNEKEFIEELASKAELVCAKYCLSSAQYLSQGRIEGIIGKQIFECQYGENPWQKPAAFYSRELNDPLSLDKFQVVAGLIPSYNNLCDIDRLIQTITHIAAGFDLNRDKVPLIAVGVKHGNACGAAIGEDPKEVIQKMLKGDLLAIFGGLVCTNFEIDEVLAEELLTFSMPDRERRLLDGIIAPSFTKEAVSILRRKGDKCRFLVNPALGKLNKLSIDSLSRFRYVRGGFLSQPNYTFVLNLKDSVVEKSNQLSLEEEDNLLLAWAIGSTSNSNTISLVSNKYLIGNGVGQQDRVGCCKIAIAKAKEGKHDTVRAVAFSDSFFPFTDGPGMLAEAGIGAILASGGSVHDEEIKKFCQEKGVALYLLDYKLGRGFYGH